MKTVLILAYECAPHHRPGSTIGAQRPYQFAKHLHKYGWKPVVLCCDFKQRRNLKVMDLGEVLNEVNDRMKVWNDVDRLVIPLPSLTHADFWDKVWFKSVRMVDDLGTFIEKRGWGYMIGRKVSSFIKLFRGDHSQSWQKVVESAAQIIIEQTDIDMIIAEHGPDASLFVASQLHNTYGIPWMIDFRDPIERDFPPLQRFIYRTFTIPQFATCACTINVNPHWVELDNLLFKKEGVEITNGFDEEEFEFKRNKNISSDKLIIGYFGNIHQGQMFESFFEGLKRLQDIKIKFMYRGTAYPYLKRIAEEKEVPLHMLDMGPRIERKAAMDLFSQCHIMLLISLRENNPFYRQGFYPGKVFEYIGLEKPILVVPGDEGLLDSLVVGNKIGRIASSSQEIESLLMMAFEQWNKNEKIWNVFYDPLSKRKFNRQMQAEKLASAMGRFIN